MSWLDRERTIAPPGFNRWLVPPAALAVHLCIGQAYATSVYKTALVKHIGASLTEIGVIFSIAIVMLGLSAAVMGTWVDRNGPRKAMCFRCEYVARQVSVKARYALWVTQAEHDAIAGILAGCPGQPAPTSVEPAAPAAVYYANCAEVVAAGAAPLYSGSAGYRSGLDGDGDGVASEG
jgi:MFS family permease